MINQNFIYLSLVFAIIGYGGYIIDTWKGITKPSRVAGRIRTANEAAV